MTAHRPRRRQPVGPSRESIAHTRRAAPPSPLLVCDEVDYVPFEPAAAALFYALIASRCGRPSLVLSGSKPFSGWTEIFGDAVVAVAAMFDRLVHHADSVGPHLGG